MCVLTAVDPGVVSAGKARIVGKKVIYYLKYRNKRVSLKKVRLYVPGISIFPF